ncbi:MAG: hypothetical protein ABUK01_05795 [Leptospirales bacterium]
MGNYLNLPRNYSFIHRLPFEFEMVVRKKGNATNDGTWYLIQIEEHELNILSQAELTPGTIYRIQKRSNLVLEIITEQKPQKNSQDGFYA